MSTNNTTLTIWYMPRTPYPRRLTNYLLAKRLPRTVFSTGHLNLIPVRMDPSRGTFTTAPGHEPKPEGFTLPVLCVTTGGDAPHWITQSATILEYLETAFPAAAGFRDLRGATPEARARSRDIVLFAHELMQWTNVQMRHAAAGERLHWFGVRREHVSAGAAADAALQVEKLLARVEGLVRADVLERGAASLAGGDGVTIGDCVFAAFVGAGRELMGVDWIEGCEALTVWYGRTLENGWLPSAEMIGELEEGNLEGLFVGEGEGEQ